MTKVIQAIISHKGRRIPSIGKHFFIAPAQAQADTLGLVKMFDCSAWSVVEKTEQGRKVYHVIQSQYA